MLQSIANEIIDFGKKLLELNSIEQALQMISDEAKTLMKAERCTIFMVDHDAQMLWSKLSDGIGRIAIALDSGIAGDTYMSREGQMVNAPYDDARFMAKIDEKSGFHTRNILTTPIFNSRREVIGVIQLLNKEQGDFTDADAEALQFLANYISGTLELILIQNGRS